MAMTEHSFSCNYAEVASFEERKLRVLDGRAAKEKADAKRMDVIKLVLIVTTVLVYLLSLVFVEAKVTSAGAEINNLKAQIVETQNLSAISDLTIGSLSSLSYVEEYAMSNLNMVYPHPDETYFLDEISSLDINMAMNGVVAASVEPEIVAENSFWKNVSEMFRGYFNNSVIAAVE